MNVKNKYQDILICECASAEHQIIIRNWQEDDDVYCTIHLTTYKNFFKRFWRGLKYAFGYKCKYGDWDDFVLGAEHINNLKNIIRILEKDKIQVNLVQRSSEDLKANSCDAYEKLM